MSLNIPASLDQEVENKMNFIFSLITLLLVILLAFFTRYMQQAEMVNENDRLGYIYLDYTDKLSLNLLNLETQTQKILLTKDNYFTIPFEESIDEIKKAMDGLESRGSSYVNRDEVQSVKEDIASIIMYLTEIPHQEDRDIRSQSYRTVQTEINALQEKIRTMRERIRHSIRGANQTNITALSTLRWAMFGLAVISFALLFISFRQARQQQKSAKKYTKEISDRNNNLEKIVNKRTEELIALASSVTTSSENERKRIARELHDELGALLTAARMDTSWIKRTLKPAEDDPMKVRLDRLLENIDNGIHVKRAITNSLVPPLLRELGLLEAITAMTEDTLEENPPEYHLELSTDLPVISSDLELALYRICQESMNNIRKYAEASNVTIRLLMKEDTDTIELYIIDDGKGFDKALLRKGTHGITGMRARAAMFGGVATVFSPAHQGTTVKAVFPVNFDRE
jgi:signal transduction histidine kinase